MEQCVILGGGGHARVLIDSLTAGNAQLDLVILDPDRSLWDKAVFGVRVLGDDDELPNLSRMGASWFVIGVGGTRDNRPRQRLFNFARACGLRPLTVIHPRAICSKAAAIGEGCQLLPGCIVNAGASLGKNVLVNSGAIVEHDCIIGDHVHVATGARLASSIRVGSLAHIGAGATVRECLTIGDEAVVGAGAAVVRNVEPRSVVAGVPARVMRHCDGA